MTLQDPQGWAGETEACPAFLSSVPRFNEDLVLQVNSLLACKIL